MARTPAAPDEDVAPDDRIHEAAVEQARRADQQVREPAAHERLDREIHGRAEESAEERLADAVRQRPEEAGVAGEVVGLADPIRGSEDREEHAEPRRRAHVAPPAPQVARREHEEAGEGREQDRLLDHPEHGGG